MNTNTINATQILSDRTILVCQGRCCQKDGSKGVLKTFQSQAIPKVQIIASGCLGQCGNGPNVLILPEKVWHQKVNAEDVLRLLKFGSKTTG